MAELTYTEAVNAGISQDLRHDKNDVLHGVDIAAAGGVFTTTMGLLDEFHADRVRDTPISEQAIIGAAMGAAMVHRTKPACWQTAKRLMPGYINALELLWNRSL